MMLILFYNDIFVQFLGVTEVGQRDGDMTVKSAVDRLKVSASWCSLQHPGDWGYRFTHSVVNSWEEITRGRYCYISVVHCNH